MSALDDLQANGEYTELESVIVTYAFHERRARGDDKNPASAKAAAELSALRERVEEAELRNKRALEWLEHYPSQDDQEEQAEVNRRRAILILSGKMKVKP